jgi:Cellulase (glycosyl hydrolase family 5)
VHQGRFAMPRGETAAFLLWSSGYAALKMGFIGWAPSLAGVLAFRARSRVGGGRAAANASLPQFVSGGAILFIALLGPWLAGHWWRGSPVGYIYSAGSSLFAPTAASGLWRSLLAIALMGFFAWRHQARCLRGMTASADAATLFWSGATAGFAAAGALLAGQLIEVAFQVPQSKGAADYWLIPAALLRAVEAASFALPVAVVAGCLAVLGARGPWTKAALPKAGWAMGALACVLASLAAWNVQAPPPRAHSPPDGQRTGLSVRTDAAGTRIVDSSGAAVILRGVNVNQLGEYYQQDPSIASSLPLTEQDFADIAALGMNVVRLTLSWSQMEPQRNRISTQYLERIRQAVAWARAHNIYVVLDMHQDAWGAHVAAEAHHSCRAGTAPMIGWDGAPAWATQTDGTPPCQVTGRDLAPNLSRAFQSFYVDRDGIQSSLIAAWQAVAEQFAGDPTVAGYDLLNEPNFGDTPPIASTVLLANYYARSIEAIRQAENSQAQGFHHLVFVEPSIIWSGFGLDNLPPRGFTADPQIVFSPHLYNESITADQDFGFNLISIERGFALAEAAAEQLHAPLWIGEWGYFKGAREQAPLIERHLRAEDALHIGSAFWVWKQACGDPHAYPGKVAGDLRLTGCPDNADLGTATDMTRHLQRPYVRRQAADCEAETWVPGNAPPKAQSITRIEPGDPKLGQSGGWLAGRCP